MRVQQLYEVELEERAAAEDGLAAAACRAAAPYWASPSPEAAATARRRPRTGRLGMASARSSSWRI